jgi:hypothetical protein
MFALGLSGLVPLTVVNTRQIQSLAGRMPADETYYLVPPENAWAAKLGAPAEVSQDPPPPQSPVVDLVDDGDTGFAQKNRGWYDWYRMRSSSAYGGDYWLNYPDSKGDEARWTFEDLTAGRYKVFVTYRKAGYQARNARFHVYDRSTELGVAIVNQRTPPSGPVYQGYRWDSLGTFVIHSGVLRVELTDDADGYIAADAIRIVPVKNELDVLGVNASPDTGTLNVEVSVAVP